MARLNDPHSATSQFFINAVNNTLFDYIRKDAEGWGYCVFGKVVSGESVIDKIRKVDTGSFAGHQDVPREPVVIESITIIEE